MGKEGFYDYRSDTHPSGTEGILHDVNLERERYFGISERGSRALSSSATVALMILTFWARFSTIAPVETTPPSTRAKLTKTNATLVFTSLCIL